MDLCIDFIVGRFDETNGEENSVQFLSGDVREKLMWQLLRRRKLTAANSLVWIWCSLFYSILYYNLMKRQCNIMIGLCDSSIG